MLFEKYSITELKTAKNLSRQFPFDNHRTSVCIIKYFIVVIAELFKQTSL